MFQYWFYSKFELLSSPPRLSKCFQRNNNEFILKNVNFNIIGLLILLKWNKLSNRLVLKQKWPDFQSNKICSDIFHWQDFNTAETMCSERTQNKKCSSHRIRIHRRQKSQQAHACLMFVKGTYLKASHAIYSNGIWKMSRRTWLC